MRVARAFRLPIIAAMTALALSGCMQSTGPVAMGPSQSDLDYMAYGQPYNSTPATAVADSGGAISALRASFAAAPRSTYAPASAA
ncbi:MAG: polysaccharide export protein, partial [Bradyrhizobium sp.]